MSTTQGPGAFDDDLPLTGPKPPAPWSRRVRQLAVALWTGFLGAAFLLMGFLMAWDHLWPTSEGPELLSLTAIFGLAWLSNSITALMAQSLAPDLDLKPAATQSPHD